MVLTKEKITASLRTRRFLSAVSTVLMFFWFSSCMAFAACHAVTATGSGTKTGVDWNNAYAGIPGTLTRGDIYYLADGTYTSNSTITFSQAGSGTLTVEIRKAQSYDHCTDTGWNTSTMGSSQASFAGSTAFYVSGPYFTINGNGTSRAPGCGGAPGNAVTSEPPTRSDCGIRLVGTGNSTSGANNIVSILSNNLTLKYVELVGSGYNGNDLEIFGSGASNLTIQHMYARNSGCVYIQDVGDGSLVDHSYFWGTEVYGAAQGCHGQAEFENGGTSNGVRSNNVYRDIIGTAVWTFAAGSGTNNNWQFYNNVIWYSSPMASWVSSAGSAAPSDGILACINSGVNCTNFTLSQNTIVNVPVFGQPGINNENTGSYTVVNNLWYGNSFGVSFSAGSGGSYTQNHNSFLNSTAGCPSGTANVCNNASANPFNNWPAGDFSLASDAANWNNRLSLSAPSTTDVAGNTFTTDRGAFQYMAGGTGGNGLTPPTGLAAIVQ